MKKSKNQKIKSPNLKYLLPILVISLLFLGAVTYQNQQTSSVLGKTADNQMVLGEENSRSAESEEGEEAEEVESTESPEPPEEPEPDEPTEEDEQEAEDIQDEIENEVEQDTVEEIEVESSSQTQGKGTLKVKNVDGTTDEKIVPISTTPLVQFQNTQAGTVAVSVGTNGTITLVNNGVTVTTNYPVVIDPKTQTIAVRTASGVTLINTLPAQALNNVNATDKPTVVESALLEAQNGEMYYAVKGTQARKFVGLVPVTANIKTQISAENGSVLAVERPWYLNLLGFLYTV